MNTTVLKYVDYQATIFCLFASLLLSGSAFSSTDSDGYYCVSLGYFAHESRSFHTDGIHRIFVIPLAEKIGIGPSQPVVIPHFQFHGMRCTATGITVFGPDAAYEIDLSDLKQPRYIARISPPDISRLHARFAGRRFGDTPELPLNVSDGAPTEFVLRVSFIGERHPNSMEYTTLAKIVRLSKTGELIDSRLIFAETVLVSNDE